MIHDDYADLAAMIVDACDETERAAVEFVEQHGVPWIRNARFAFRQSVLAARLRVHDTLGVVEAAGVEGGRIKVTGLGDSHLLLKPLSSLVWPTDSAPAVQPPLPEMRPAEGEPLLAYTIDNQTVTLYEGACRQINTKGWPKFEIVGELSEVWSGDVSGEFDQGADDGWTDDMFGDSAAEDESEL